MATDSIKRVKFSTGERLSASKLNMAFEDRQYVDFTGPNNILRPKGLPWNRLAFGYYLVKNVVTIYTGNLRQHGIQNISISETDVTLSGDPEYVYVNHQRGSSSATILHSQTEPVSNSTTLKVPLYKFEVVTGMIYKISQILHFGDINFDTPIQ